MCMPTLYISGIFTIGIVDCITSLLTVHTAPLGDYAHAQLLVNSGHIVGGSDVPDKCFIRKLQVSFNAPHPVIEPRATRDFLALPPSVHADVQSATLTLVLVADSC